MEKRLVKIRRLKPIHQQIEGPSLNGERLIKVKTDVPFKIDNTYLENLKEQSEFDSRRRNSDRNNSGILSGSKFSD